MKEPSDEDINKRIAEFDGREILGEYNVFYKYRDKGSVYIKLMSKTFYTSSLDSLIPVVDQVLFKLEISVWVEPRLGISGVVFNSWTKRIGGYARINAMTDYSPSRALALALYQVLEK